MIYSIGDLHFDHTKNKSMDIFGEKWLNHDVRIIENWNNTIKEDDLVLIPGDISWALKLEDAIEDLRVIDELPGKKIMIKGNHDYWWGSLSKLNRLNMNSIIFMQNNSFIYKDIGIAGTRGWLSKDNDEFKQEDEKIFLRELNRLKLSLESLGDSINKKIVMIHYPPFNMDLSPNEFVLLMREYKVDICVYGHLHAEGHKYAVEGRIDEIEFHLVSCDYIDFMPKKIIGE
ncbi:metallophosphoesterase [Paratissierella segnis]|jgi:hypothetical protein|uniref:Metallophosphoesterase n=1 Tax=Paratissierella segnis TaxID=2763679 RepID=A0A926EW56_9FIRM|nr:metallophosphoesterase [Paratissierella segnis]MBC8589418.1 metallophosphoesterase [Paratissierella segnis]